MAEHDLLVQANMAAIEACASGMAAEQIARSYEDKWEVLRSPNPDTEGRCLYREFPFPVFFPPGLPPAPMHITLERVRAFVHAPHWAAWGQSPRARVMAELVRWHPDHFMEAVLPKVAPSDRCMLEEAAKVVVLCLVELRSESNH